MCRGFLTDVPPPDVHTESPLGKRGLQRPGDVRPRLTPSGRTAWMSQKAIYLQHVPALMLHDHRQTFSYGKPHQTGSDELAAVDVHPLGCSDQAEQHLLLLVKHLHDLDVLSRMLGSKGLEGTDLDARIRRDGPDKQLGQHGRLILPAGLVPVGTLDRLFQSGIV